MTIKFLKKHDFTKCALGISGIMESIEDLFKCDNCFCFTVNCLPDYTISAFAKLLDYFEFLEDVLFDFFTHFWVDFLGGF